MFKEKLHIWINAKRRGGRLPARSRISSKRGVTLVELLIAMLILTLVCIAWLQIIGIQSARREARRREAVERLAGIMDAFMYCYKGGGLNTGDYRMTTFQDKIKFEYVSDSKESASAQPVFDTEVSPVGYRLTVLQIRDLASKTGQSYSFTEEWKITTPRMPQYWLLGRLYDGYGDIDAVGEPFFSLPVCMGY